MPEIEKEKEEHSEEHKVTVSLSLNSLSSRLPFIFLALVFLGFSFYLFTRANFHTAELFDVSRYEYNALKLTSISFILFLFSFAFSMAFAIHGGFGSSKIESAVAAIAYLITAAAAGLLAPAYSLAFIAFGITLAAAHFASSSSKEQTFGTAWSSAGTALFLLLILSVVFTYAKIAPEKEHYFDVFLNSTTDIAKDAAASFAPEAARQALNLCANTIERVEINEANVKNAISKADLQASLEHNPTFSSLPEGTKNQLADAYYQSATEQALTVSNKLKNDLAAGIRNASLSQQASKEDLDKALSPAALRQQLDKIPQAKAAVAAFPIVAALSVASLVSLMNFLIKIITSLTAYGIKKIT